MERHQLIEQITNGFNAASKIRKMYNSPLQRNEDTAVNKSRVAIMQEALQILGNHSPGPVGNDLEATLRSVSVYFDTYMNLKRHLSENRNGPGNTERFAGGLGIVRPALSNRQKTMIDKMLKIYEILALEPSEPN